MVYSLLFVRIPLSQLPYFKSPIIWNEEKFVLAFVINITFPVICFYDDNPLRLSQIPGNALKDTSVFCFPAVNQPGKGEKQPLKACNEVKDENKYQRKSSRC